MTTPAIRVFADPAWGWCAGVRHPPEAAYPAGFFSPSQLEQLRADPALRVEEVEAMQGGGPGQDETPGAGGAAGDAPGAQGDVVPPGAPTGAGGTPAPVPPPAADEAARGTHPEGAGEAAAAGDGAAGELGLADGRDAPTSESEGRAGADGGSAPAKRPAAPRKGRAAPG